MEWLNSQAGCPVTEVEREWLESGMGWLAKEFGWDRLCTAQVVLPTSEFFPDRFTGKPEDVRAMLDRVCSYMDVRSETVELDFYVDRNPVYDGRSPKRTAGLYEQRGGKHHVWIESGTIADPLALAATIAHEVGHVRLLGEGRISPDDENHEPLTDLLTVFLGLGVLTSNSVVREKYWHAGNTMGWSIGRGGYLTMLQFGYALALFAHVREEWKPTWSKELRLDVRTPFLQGARFLTETQAPTFEVKQFSIAGPTNLESTVVDEDEVQTEETSDDEPRCTYCGVVIDSELILPQLDGGESPDDAESPVNAVDRRRRKRFGVCLACRESIDENVAEADEEVEQSEHDRFMMGRILKVGCAFIVWCFVLFLVVVSCKSK